VWSTRGDHRVEHATQTSANPAAAGTVRSRSPASPVSGRSACHSTSAAPVASSAQAVRRPISRSSARTRAAIPQANTGSISGSVRSTSGGAPSGCVQDGVERHLDRERPHRGVQTAGELRGEVLQEQGERDEPLVLDEARVAGAVQERHGAREREPVRGQHAGGAAQEVGAGGGPLAARPRRVEQEAGQHEEERHAE
jgi:hypothetical protein